MNKDQRHVGSDLTLGDVNAVGEAISKKVAPDAIIFFGMVNDPDGQQKVGITVIATGIPDDDNHHSP